MREEGRGSMKQACGNRWSWVMGTGEEERLLLTLVCLTEASVRRSWKTKLPSKRFCDDAAPTTAGVWLGRCAQLRLSGAATDTRAHAPEWGTGNGVTAERVQNAEEAPAASGACAQGRFAPPKPGPVVWVLSLIPPFPLVLSLFPPWPLLCSSTTLYLPAVWNSSNLEAHFSHSGNSPAFMAALRFLCPLECWWDWTPPANLRLTDAYV